MPPHTHTPTPPHTYPQRIRVLQLHMQPERVLPPQPRLPLARAQQQAAHALPAVLRQHSNV